MIGRIFITNIQTNSEVDDEELARYFVDNWLVSGTGLIGELLEKINALIQVSERISYGEEGEEIYGNLRHSRKELYDTLKKLERIGTCKTCIQD